MQLPSGVAANIDVTHIFAALQGGTLKSVAANIFRPAYYIRLAGQRDIALEVNGVSELQNTGTAVVTTSPIEGGTYQVINKVKQPTQIICSVILNGFGLANFDFRILERAAGWLTDSVRTPPVETLKRIKDMINSTSLYDIETPKETFRGYDLINYRYMTSNKTGVTMLTVQLTFQEIIQKLQVNLAGGTASRAGVTPVDSDIASKAASALERGGIVSKITSSVSDTINETGDLLDKFSDIATSARNDAIRFIKDNIL